jgi:RHS repeat-associated protein
MAAIARDQLAAISGGVSAGFQYDSSGRRISKTVSGVTTGFTYYGANPVQELSGGTPTANLLTGLGIDEVFLRSDGSGARTLIADGLGSTMALLDAAGVSETQYSYEPFGKTTVAGSRNSNSFQYTGRENDGTGLYYYRARYYSPAFQRFIGEDPIGFRGGSVNLHQYTHNNPVDLQ